MSDGTEQNPPYAFIRWKGTDGCTDGCMEFYCECGAQFNLDDYFAYTVQCPTCMVVRVMEIDEG